MEIRNIAIIEPIGGHGGMDYYDYGLAMGLGENNINVYYYTSNQTKVRTFNNVQTIICFKNMWKKNFIVKSIKYIVGHVYAFLHFRKKGKIIHLHFFTFRSIDFLILLLGKSCGFKIVVTIHDINAFDKKPNRIIEKGCYRLMDSIIVHNKSSYAALNNNFKQSNISIIPHGNYLPFITEIKQFPIQNECFTLLFFGQVKEVKGVDLLIRAVNLIKGNGHKIKLVIAGKVWKTDLDIYENLIKNLNVQDSIETDFKYIPDSQVSSFYAMADLVVLPYREIYQSGVLLLTMSFGRPLLCSDLEPFKEVISNGQNGFIFKSENIEDLAKQIIFIMEQSELLKKVIKQANVDIRENHDWVKIGKMTQKVYIDL